MRDHFPVRPRPKHDESIRGFLVRLAKRNGFFSINDIFRLLGLKYSASSLDVTDSRFRKFIEKLAPTLKCAFEMIFSPLKEATANQHDDYRTVIDIASQKPKLCPDCLCCAEPYIKASWQMVHITHCVDHSVPLIDTCPSCKKSLKWNADLLEGCFQCGHRWQKSFEPASDILPLHQVMHLRLENEALRLYLMSLYTAAQYLRNPSVFISHQSKCCDMGAAEAAEIFPQAYAIIQDSFYSSQYHRSVLSLLNNQYCFTDKQSLQNLPNILSTLPQLPMYLPADKNFERKFVDPNANLVTALTDSQAASLLGISAKELNEVSQQFLLPVGKISRSSVYQLKHLDAFTALLLEKVRFTNRQSDAISITAISSISHKFLFNYGEALKLILDNDLPLQSDRKSPIFKDITVSKTALLELLHCNEAKQFTRSLSPSELATYFCVDTLKIRMMADLFGWQRIIETRNSYRFSPDEIWRFVSNYVLLDRWCSFQLYGHLTLHRYLKNIGFKPLDSPADNKSKLYIYKKSDSLVKAITQFEKEWHRFEAPRSLKYLYQTKKPAILSTSALEQFQQRCKF
ncbi:hypothetical protein CA267_008850 [Alteromonas pelagimontana]|uniref:TniQ domain-containing protein n=1 Tax=Alteromonas pelagimontana TaxID=1858656 RepID=A0A6M4MCS1_9ALTE|nr:TniQ family protein [Alteromonas pelagimontana]QJR80879.1 hypothetical protein CA267_008850 [Alteromonas pelagimontana]